MKQEAEKRGLSLALTGLASVVGLVSLMLLASARADAADYCVNMPAGTTCAMTFNSNLPGALTKAETNAGPDRVLIGPVTRSNTAGFTYFSADAANTVQIIGSGPSTILTGVDTTNSATQMALSGPPGSGISNLAIKIPANVDVSADAGLALGGGETADKIKVTGVSGTSNAYAINEGNDVITNANINLPHDATPNYGMFARGSTSISDSKITADNGVFASTTGGVTSISNTRIDSNLGVSTDSGTIEMKDSLITLGNTLDATGIQLDNSNPGTSAMEADLDGVSIVSGSALPDGDGIYAHAKDSGKTATVNMANTVITGTEQAMLLDSSGGGSINASTRYSAYDQSTVQKTPGTGTINFTMGTGDVDLTGDPGFLSTTGPDYVPLGTSPLVDAGDPAPPAAGRKDLLGSPRACHGTDSGVIRRDIGAFERQTVLADDCTYPQTTITSGAGSRTTNPTPAFGFSSSKVSSSFKCSFDGHTSNPCSSGDDAPNLGLGTHTLSVRAIDEFGNIDQSPATTTYTVLKPPDKTPPHIKVLGKVPKKTKKKVLKIRFKSNEAGSTFKCKVNRAKAKKCKSPLKARLKRGRNTIRIVATDKAGNHSRAKVLKIKRK